MWHRLFVGLAAVSGVLLMASFAAVLAGPASGRAGAIVPVGLAATVASLLCQGSALIALRVARVRIGRLPLDRLSARANRNARRASPFPALALPTAAVPWLIGPIGTTRPDWSLLWLATASAAIGFHLAALAVAVASVLAQRSLWLAARAEAARQAGAIDGLGGRPA